MVDRRVVFSLNSYVYGGVEEHVALLSSALPRHGFYPVVMVPDTPGLAPLVDRLNGLGVEHILHEPGNPALRKQWRAVESLRRILRDLRADILHVQLVGHDGGRLPLLSALRAGVPAVVTHHIPPRHTLHRVERLARAPFLRLVARFIAVSEANHALQVTRVGLPASRVVTVHNGIVARESPPDRAAARASLRQELGLPYETPVVGSVGRLTEQKGLKYLIDAAPGVVHAVPEAHFVFIGDGPLLQPLQEQADRLGVAERMHWLGFRPSPRDLMAGLDALAMPSEFEGLPITLLEAMEVGTPPVAHAVDGVPEAVTDAVEGFLVARGDVPCLAQRVAQVLSNPELGRELGRRARARVLREFTVDAMASATASVYDEAIAASRGGGRARRGPRG